MKNLFNKIKQFIITHKTVSIIALVIISLVGYWGYGKITNTAGETRYVTAKVTRGTIIASITGTGQVSASNQIDLKTKASGDITYLPIISGQKVNSGSLIAQLDTSDSQKTIRDAEASLESAKLSLEKLKIQNSNDNMNADLVKAYDDGFSAVSNVFLDLPNIVSGLSDLLGYQNLSENAARVNGNTAITYRKKAEASYYATKSAFEKNRIDFRQLARNSKKEDLDIIINETYTTVNLSADAVKDFYNYINYLAEDSFKASDYTSYQNSLSADTNTINGYLTNLLSVKTSIKNNKDAFLNTNLDIQSSELTVKQKENALQDAKDKLKDYSVYAPFGGTISNVAVKKSDSVSSGTTIATLITEKQIAELSLNEVDIAKIAIGQKATLTFDAIPDLTITGKVSEIDSVGTVSSGVVNYMIKINFDTNDVRVKPSMSVNATIITNIKQDVLSVPNSAVKSQPMKVGQNGKNYVETLSTELPASIARVQGSPSLTPPSKTNVVIGISNDTLTEIISGLNEGDIVVTKIITGTNTKTAPSLLNAVGGNKSGGSSGASAVRALH